MKSVIVQGTTVAKAIDEALVKAGMPVEFFIKVLEEAQPGFLGFGSKKAKIALFFKKEQGRRDGSLLSRGSYKDLFENENLQAQPLDQIKQDKVVEKKEALTPVAVSHRKIESQQPQPKKVAQVAPQPRKVEVQQSHSRKIEPLSKKVENKGASVQQEPKKIVEQKVIVQRPLGQRPLKFNNEKQPEIISVAPHVGIESQQVAKIVDSLQKDDAQTEVSQNKRPRRRRRYGYRSKAPIQWGKSQDDTELQSSDERHDSE